MRWRSTRTSLAAEECGCGWSWRSLPLLLVCLCLLAASGAGKDTPLNLNDKTLVAWLTLGDLEQKGGAAISIIDEDENFDALVFGEVEPGRWMAGSDFFRRTHQDQADWPAETAGPDALVQVAIVYAGKRVTLFRDGEPYAGYDIEQPQPFDLTTDAVLLGLRYSGGMGEVGFFNGALEEVRIYDRPLDAAALRTLEPGTPSDPPPVACWNFEDGAVRDAMGALPDGVLHGGARIENGRLLLNGTDAWVEVRRPIEPGPRTMFYRPRLRETGRMWDTWLYLHEGVYYLYYLANSGAQWDNISLATSRDGVHWKEHGSLIHKLDRVTWMGTGTTWRSPLDDGKFLINYSEWTGPRQTIFFAESTDLVNWTRLGDDYEFVQDTRWYEPEGRWDCIYTIPNPEGGLYGYWTATPKAETGGRFGFGRSADGRRWEALPPPETPGVGEGEAGAVEKIGDRYYMMFGTQGMMVTLVAERPEGPFLPAAKNFRLLSGHTYFSRFFPTPDGVLANYHAITRSGPVYFAPLKKAAVDAEGTLRLAWWPGNEAMKHDRIDVRVAADVTTGNPRLTMIENEFDSREGFLIEGSLCLPESDGAPRRGLWLEHKAGGTAILFDAAGKAELGVIGPDGEQFTMEKAVDRERSFGAPARFRLLVKEGLLEVYLDDILIENFSLPARSTGRIGLIAEPEAKAFGKLHAWRGAADED